MSFTTMSYTKSQSLPEHDLSRANLPRTKMPERILPKRILSNKNLSNKLMSPSNTLSRSNRVLRSGIKTQSGFTLVEVAIVLVIIGLILGGVFKGQSLIDSARVRSLSTDVSGIRAAWYSFQERYRSIPGDFSNAQNQIDSAAKQGNGNGRIDDSQERAGVWQQMALAGFIPGDFDGAVNAAGSASDMTCAAGTCPKNPFNGFYKISYSAQAADVDGLAHEIFTGEQIPVSILSQLDSKLDDGKPSTGRFRVHRAYMTACTKDGQWDIESGHTNCAGVLRE